MTRNREEHTGVYEGMKKQRILSVFLLLIVVCGIVLWKDNKREVKIEVAEQVTLQ